MTRKNSLGSSKVTISDRPNGFLSQPRAGHAVAVASASFACPTRAPCRRVMRAAGQHATAAGRLVFSALSAALAQPTAEPSDHGRGQQECDDHANADEYIDENDSGAALDGHDARRRFASMSLYGQWSGSPRRFNALSCFNVRLDSPARGAIYYAHHVVASRSLPRLLRALPAQPSREAAHGRRLAARDQARRLPGYRTQGR